MLSSPGRIYVKDQYFLVSYQDAGIQIYDYSTKTEYQNMQELIADNFSNYYEDNPEASSQDLYLSIADAMVQKKSLDLLGYTAESRLTYSYINISTFETLYPFSSYCFAGGNDGMFILNVEYPSYPTLVSFFQHATVCDPVVVSGDYAFVTLRSDTDNAQCQGITNEMDIIDISDIYSPELVSVSTEVSIPKGLGVIDNTAWVYDQSQISIFDVSDKENPVLRSSILDMENAYDIIPYYDLLFVSADSGVYLYSIDPDPFHPEYLCSLLSE